MRLKRALEFLILPVGIAAILEHRCAGPSIGLVAGSIQESFLEFVDGSMPETGSSSQEFFRTGHHTNVRIQFVGRRG